MFFEKELHPNQNKTLPLDYNNQELMTSIFKNSIKFQVSQLTSIEKLKSLDENCIPRIGHKVSAEQIAALRGVKCIIFTGRMCRLHIKDMGLLVLPANIGWVICSFENKHQKESFPQMIPDHISVYEQSSANTLCLVRATKFFIATSTKLQSMFVPPNKSQNKTSKWPMDNKFREQQPHLNLKRKWTFIEEEIEKQNFESTEKEDIETISEQLVISLKNEDKLKAMLVRKNRKIDKKNKKLKQITDIVGKLEMVAGSIMDVSKQFKMHNRNENVEDVESEYSSDSVSTESESSDESYSDNSINPKDYQYIPLIDRVISKDEKILGEETDQNDKMSIPRF